MISTACSFSFCCCCCFCWVFFGEKFSRDSLPRRHLFPTVLAVAAVYIDTRYSSTGVYSLDSKRRIDSLKEDKLRSSC